MEKYIYIKPIPTYVFFHIPERSNDCSFCIFTSRECIMISCFAVNKMFHLISMISKIHVLFQNMILQIKDGLHNERRHSFIPSLIYSFKNIMLGSKLFC